MSQLLISLKAQDNPWLLKWPNSSDHWNPLNVSMTKSIKTCEFEMCTDVSKIVHL